MKEMIERLIADGWEWVASDGEGVYLYQRKPEKELQIFVNIGRYTSIPSCLFPNITFENSPVELKTLLVDDEEQDNIQREIKMLIVWKFEYLLKQGNGEVHAYNADGTEWRNANRLKNFVPEVHEKVYLKDLVEKRKEKKSVWHSVDADGSETFTKQKPIRGDNSWRDEKGNCTCFNRLEFLTWEDEPLELTYEVEE